ncbi:MAG: hypothetical protein WDZ59_10745 [Pirellulales bacterium]
MDHKRLNTELLPLVAAGDIGARDRMIESNVGLVRDTVRRFLTSRPQFKYLRDDLISEGILGLAEAVRDIAAGAPVQHVAAYLRKAVFNQLDSHVTAHGNTIKTPRMRDAENVRRIEEDDCDPRNHHREVDLADEIMGSCQDDVEREIVRLRIQGYKDVEVAERLRLSTSWINDVRRKMYERFLTRNPEYRRESP